MPDTSINEPSTIPPHTHSGIDSPLVDKNANSIPSPGGSDKNVQYDNNGVFGGVSNNTTTTDMYLHQVSAGTPNFQQVSDTHLLMHDSTGNNVSTTAHGFAPKSPNDATKYLDGTGAYSVPAGNPLYVTGTSSKNIADASTTQTIVHNMNRTPKGLRIYAIHHVLSASNVRGHSLGVYDGSNNNAVYVNEVGTDGTGAYLVYDSDNGGNGQSAVFSSWSTTQFVISWTKLGVGNGTIYFTWEIFA